jgi:phospholipid/cholesterol/gamma-HCH transport system permease protein
MRPLYASFGLWVPLPRQFSEALGRRLFRLLLTIHGLGAFALITLGVMISRFRAAHGVVRPLVLSEAWRAGVQLLPMFLFVSAALGLLVIGQSVAWLTRVGAISYLGTIMVLVVVRELGPLLTALLVLARVGTANVIELGTSRAVGEVEALKALGIDPVHYLVVPRVVGMVLAVFSLTIYLILGALLSGYLWAFLEDVPLPPAEYFRQLARALSGLDFVLLALKTAGFGFVIAMVSCYHGLAQPLRLEQVSNSTVSTVVQSIGIFLLIDVLFIVVYLVT